MSVTADSAPRRRRDGQIVQGEPIASAQQAGRGPSAPATATGIATAAAALAATRRAAGVADVAPSVVKSAAATAAINAAAVGILSAFDRFYAGRRAEQGVYVEQVLEHEAPELDAGQRQSLADEEMARERLFAAKSRTRIAAALPDILEIADPASRRAALEALLARERRIIKQREDAMRLRTTGTVEQRRVEQESPEGGFWKLSEHAQTHTPDCLAMAGKVWPHSILRIYHPPLHGACPCSIITPAQATKEGLLTDESQWQTADQAVPAMQVTEQLALDGDELAVFTMGVLEVGYDTRWGKGTTKAGQFRPRRGGDPGSVILHDHLPRMAHAFTADELIRNYERMHGTSPSDKQVADLRSKYPSEGARPVTSIDRANEVRDLAVKDLGEGDHVMVNGQLERVTKVHAGTPGLVELEHTGLAHIDRDTIRGIKGDGAVRAGEVKGAGPDQPEPPEPPAGGTGRPAPAPAGVPGRISHDQAMKVARMRKPAEGGELAPGIHYNPDLTRSEARGDDLHLPPGFFKLSRAKREAVIHRHHGRVLADSLGDDGVKQFGEPHLGSRKSVVDAYYGINADATREQYSALHPDAAQKVATAALERGLPLHPDAARLARRPAAIDTPAPEHPAHELAAQLVGNDEAQWGPKLRSAGYTFSGSMRDMQGNLQVVHNNHDVGASIITTHASGGVTDGNVTAASAIVHAPVPASEADALKGMDSKAAIDHMTEQGFGAWTSVHQNGKDWMEFVHPDGRGRALEVNDDLSVGRVRAFTPTDDEVQRSRNIVIGRNPLQAIKPGDDMDGVQNALSSPTSQWRVGTMAPDGTLQATSRTDPDDRIIVKSEQRDGRRVVTAVGQGSISEPGRIVTPAEHEAEVQAARAQRDRETAEAEAQRQEAQGQVLDAVRAGDAAKLQQVLEGMSVPAAVTTLRDQYGMPVIARRNSGRGANARVTYTVRGPNAETIQIGGPRSFGHSALDSVKIAANPQGGKRDRLPAGTAPKDAKQLLVDALGRADELAGRFGGKAHVTGIVTNNVARGAAAHHEMNGTIAMRPDGVKALDKYLKRRKAGETLTEGDHLNFYSNLETVQHEINHGVGAVGDGSGDGGLAFSVRKHYQGIGAGIEESLTEENAHTLTADWLRSYGMNDVLQAVKSYPTDHRITGVYQQHRARLKRILDDANIPAGDRQALLERLKFQSTPEEQRSELARLDGSGDLATAWNHGPVTRESAARLREMTQNFEPAMRADLSDIDVAPPTAHARDGREITVGAEVEVAGLNGRVPGRVLAINRTPHGVSIVVATEDGETLTYAEGHVYAVTS